MIVLLLWIVETANGGASTWFEGNIKVIRLISTTMDNQNYKECTDSSRCIPCDVLMICACNDDFRLYATTKCSHFLW